MGLVLMEYAAKTSPIFENISFLKMFQRCVPVAIVMCPLHFKLLTVLPPYRHREVVLRICPVSTPGQWNRMFCILATELEVQGFRIYVS